MSTRTDRHRAREIAIGTLYSLDINSNLLPRGIGFFSRVSTTRR